MKIIKKTTLLLVLCLTYPPVHRNQIQISLSMSLLKFNMTLQLQPGWICPGVVNTKLT